MSQLQGFHFHRPGIAAVVGEILGLISILPPDICPQDELEALKRKQPDLFPKSTEGSYEFYLKKGWWKDYVPSGSERIR